MIRANYYTTYSPPAPFVNLDIVHPNDPTAAQSRLAQVDSGADQTLIPADAATQLGLLQSGVLQIVGITGAVQPVPLYQVVLKLGPWTINIKVGTHTSSPFVILGRDVLNLFDIEMLGRAQQLVIKVPPP